MDLENLDISFEDTIITAICESIDNPKYLSILQESAYMNDELLSHYKPLIETVEKYYKLKDDKPKITDKPTVYFRFFGKCKQAAKNVFNWWYKEEPDKKLKNLRVVLKILMVITILVLSVKMPGASKLTDKVMFTKAGNIARNISYKGSSTMLKKLFNARSIVLLTIKTIYLSIIESINIIDDKLYEKVNKKDIDANIKAYDEAIDKLNNEIEKADDKTKEILIKSRKDIENTLAKLEMIKNR